MSRESLRKATLFLGLDDDELDEVWSASSVVHYAAGTVILAEGAQGGNLRVITEGEVRISKLVPAGGEEALVMLGPGEFFGEVEFFDGSPASAQAAAHTDCEILAIPHLQLRRLMDERPSVTARFLWTFSYTLARRLRDTNERMASLLSISREFK